MTRDRINTKAELLAYMQEHPEEQLQWCSGVRNDGWWWMRNGDSQHTIHVHARAARALSRSGLVKHIKGDWRGHSYRLA